jgi:YHS domain-containing protein
MPLSNNSQVRQAWLRATLFGAFTALALSALPVGIAQAKEPAIYTGIVKGVAVGGYDPVAYFTDKKPVAGKAEFVHDHEGASYRFATAANRDAFKATPAKYTPQYGGYCAWAVSQGYTAKGDPTVWSVTDGKLFLNYNASVQSGWAKDVPNLIKKADANWPKVLDK